jgi:hypothetical protein
MFDAVMWIADLVFGTIEKLGGEWFIGIVLLVPALIMLVTYLPWWVRRGAMWKRTATVIGFTYHNEDASLASKFQLFDSFSDIDGFETSSSNVLIGESSGVPTWLLDHSTGKRKLRTTCIMQASHLKVPHFRLLKRNRAVRPEIVFEDDPEFSRTFALYGKDPESVQWLFEPMLREHFKGMFRRCSEIERSSNPRSVNLMLLVLNSVGNFEVEASDDTLIVHLSRAIDPGGARDFLSTVTETLDALRHRQI